MTTKTTTPTIRKTDDDTDRRKFEKMQMMSPEKGRTETIDGVRQCSVVSCGEQVYYDATGK